MALSLPNAARRAIRGKDIERGMIVFSHLRWDFVWQRPQQLLSRFAKARPVLFVEEPEFILSGDEAPSAKVETPCANVAVVRPILPENYGRGQEFSAAVTRLVRDAIASIPSGSELFASPILWFYNPMDAPWAIGTFNESAIVYDCMDELSQFRFAPANLIENERLLISCADIVFTGGQELFGKKTRQHHNVHFFGCGVEYDHFARAQHAETPVPDDIVGLGRPILGWFGVIDERMDYELVKQVAQARPDWSLVMVGPVVKVDPAELPKGENLHWLGGRDYSELPNYCRGFDICMMPFAINEATEFINPTKALEYLATGKPVISTPVRDVVRQYSDMILIAGSAEEFVEMVEDAIHNPNPERICAGIEKAKASTWDAIVTRMERLIEEAAPSSETKTASAK